MVFCLLCGMGDDIRVLTLIDFSRLYILTYLLTAWSRVLLEKLTGFAANQEIPRILWNPEVHYRTHKRPLPSLEYSVLKAANTYD